MTPGGSHRSGGFFVFRNTSVKGRRAEAAELLGISDRALKYLLSKRAD